MIADDIAKALAARVAEIKVANGYLTDVGTKVFRGRLRFDDDELPCTVLAELEDVPLEQPGRQAVRIKQAYVLEAHARTMDPNNPNDYCHKILFDLKRAVFAHKDALHPQVKRIEYRSRAIGQKEEGTDLVFASIRIAVEYAETLGET